MDAKLSIRVDRSDREGIKQLAASEGKTITDLVFDALRLYEQTGGKPMPLIGVTVKQLQAALKFACQQEVTELTVEGSYPTFKGQPIAVKFTADKDGARIVGCAKYDSEGQILELSRSVK